MLGVFNMTQKQKVKSDIIEQFKLSEYDTGSMVVQVALLTDRINVLNNHFNIHAKDFGSKRGLIKLVSQRRKSLDYIKKHDPKKYNELLERLNLRK